MTILIYFSPNNPTGAVSTREQLRELVAFARRNGSIIIFDAAYAAFIQDDSLPRSIFEIEGAREVALEVNSFSKPIGFTGVRLGWTVIPRELVFEGGAPVAKDWSRVMSTLFNGASNIAQYGALAALDDEGLAEMRWTAGDYMVNARIIIEVKSVDSRSLRASRLKPHISLQVIHLTQSNLQRVDNAKSVFNICT
jgi:LL-diaminopimelate aminotransferase